MTVSMPRTVEVQRRAKAAPEVVFSYFTDAARHVLWQGTEASLDPRPGGTYAVRFMDRGWIRGEFVEVDPPRRLVFTWGVETDEEIPDGIAALRPSSTIVEVDLTPDGDGTIIHVRHSGLPGAMAEAFTDQGWNHYTDRLVILLDGADPGPDPFPEIARSRR